MMKNIDFSKMKLLTVILLTAIITTVVMFISKTEMIWVFIKGISPIFTAFFLAYIFNYILTELQNRFRINKVIGLIITVFLIVMFFYIMAVALIPALKDAATKFYESLDDLTFDFNSILNINFNESELQTMKEKLVLDLKPLIQKFTSLNTMNWMGLLAGVKNAMFWVFSLIVSITIAAYMLLEKKELITRLNRTANAIFSPNVNKEMRHVLHLMDKIFKKFVVGKIIDSIIIGILTYFILILFGFEYAVLIAFFVGVTNVIPYVGPFIGAVPAILITLLASSNEPIRALYMALIILAIQQLDGLIIGPKILGDTIGVTPFWILIAITIGGAMFGFLGMFLGVPVTVLIKTIVEEYVDRKLGVKTEHD